MNNPIKVRLHVISPIHIGCDEVYEPTSFRIDEQKKKLIQFDPLEFIKSLSSQDRQKFAEICMQGTISSLVCIYEFISGKQVKGREIDIAQELISHYKQVIDLPTYGRDSEKKIMQELNQFTISRTAYNPHNNLPYIPGSSLKGSLRSAYLSAKAQEQGIKECWKRYYQEDLRDDGRAYKFIIKEHIAKKFEKDLLKGELSTDPFRMVKVSDFLPAENLKTKIIYAINRKKEKSNSKTKGVTQIFEVIQPGAIFEGLINVDSPEKESNIKNPINIEKLLESTHKFYASNLNQEKKILNNAFGIKHQADILANSKFQDKFEKSAFLVRIGRHSGAEAVTIEGNRLIRIMRGKNKEGRMQYEYKSYSTTIWLASESPRPKSNVGLLPFGWAVLEVIESGI